MTLADWLGNSYTTTTPDPGHFYQPMMPAHERYDHGGGGGGGGWAPAGHGHAHSGGGGHEKKAMKNPRTAFSALTLLAFLFFLNVLQSCLQQNMQNDNPNVNMMMNAASSSSSSSSRFKRETHDKTKGDEGNSFWTRYPPTQEGENDVEDHDDSGSGNRNNNNNNNKGLKNDENKPEERKLQPETKFELDKKETLRESRAITGDWMSQSLASIHASQLQGEERINYEKQMDHFNNNNNNINEYNIDDDNDRNELLFESSESGILGTIVEFARGWIAKVFRFFSTKAGSYLRSRALMPECHAWAACETHRWSFNWGSSGQRIALLLSEFLGWSDNNNNNNSLTKVEVARGVTHQQKLHHQKNDGSYICRRQAYDCVTRDSKPGTEWWPFISSWFH